MIPMTLQQAATISEGTLYSQGTLYLDSNKLSPVEENAELGKQRFKAIATDTRQSMKDSLFVAIAGENFDGHDYVDAAANQGAVACMLEKSAETTLPVIKVDNTIKAMGRLAKAVHQEISPSTIGITGSCGKTTVKEMTASILSQSGTVLSTRGNFNNAIGVPLTLFRLTEDDQFAVIELGASKPGDIDEIAQLVEPDVAIITNISEAHLQGLGSIEGVATVKGEILDYLQEDGVAVLEHNSPWLNQWKSKLIKNQQLRTFSLSNKQADYYATDIKAADLKIGMGTSFQANTSIGAVEIQLSTPGEHNIKNALAAMAAAISLGATLEQCKSGLADYVQVSGRLNLLQGIHGSQIIDDSYNANPASLKAAMDVLGTFSGYRVLVLGDMAELGDQSIPAHQQAGQQVKQYGFDALYCSGELSKYTAESYGEGAEYYATHEQLSSALLEKIDSSWTVLIKGSRSAAMENIVKSLQQTTQGEQVQGRKKQQKGTPICY